MKTRLPSTGSLLAFEAAARHLSFTRAATELRLSQTAISHQIKSLETLLGAQLFRREAGGLFLTDIGRDYLGRIAPALFEISAATDRAHDFSNDQSLVVACLGTFAIKCLLPNLPSFRQRHPKLNLQLLIVDSFDRTDTSTFDVGICYGVGDWPRMRVDRITHEEVFPVCSPRLLATGKKWASPKDLLTQTLIRLDSPMLRDFWPQWFEAAGFKNPPITEQIRCNRLSASIQAAINGVGVAIARSSVARPDLEAGLLVEPFSLRVSTGLEGYYLITPRERADTRKAEAFRTWALDVLSVGRTGE